MKRLLTLVVLVVGLLVATSVSEAVFFDDFSTDTSANYWYGGVGQQFELGAPHSKFNWQISGGTMNVGGANNFGEAESRYKGIDASVETLDMGEYTSMDISMHNSFPGGNPGWRNYGFLISDVANATVSGGNPNYGNGFMFVYSANAGVIYVDGFGSLNNGSICDLNPGSPYAQMTPSGVSPGDAWSGNLRIERDADGQTFRFYVDGTLLYAHDNGAVIPVMDKVAMIYNDWGTNGSVSFDNLTVNAIPEPATVVLLGSGLLLVCRRKH